MAANPTRPPTGATIHCRLRRIQGQAAGLGRMWEEGRPAEDLLDQIAAVRAALRGVAVAIVHDAANVRLGAALDTGEEAEGLDDVLVLVDRLVRCR